MHYQKEALDIKNLNGGKSIMSAFSDLIYNTPGLFLIIMLYLVGIILTVIGIYIVKIVFPIERRFKNNAGIGCLSANISVLFAILAGFIIAHLLNNFNRAQEITNIEVNQLSNIYRDASRLDKNIASEIRKEVKDYLKTVVKQEWQVMKAGKGIEASEGQIILARLRSKLSNYKSKDINQSLALGELHQELNKVYNVSDERFSMNKSALNLEIWIILIVVMFFTIIINFLYEMEHRVYLILAPLVSITILSILFLIILIDRPFRGGYYVTPEVFQKALIYLQVEDRDDFLAKRVRDNQN